MKRLSPSKRLRIARRVKRRFAKMVRRCVRAQRKDRDQAVDIRSKISERKFGPYKRHGRRTVLTLPQIMDFDDHYDESVLFLENFRQIVFIQKSRIKVDFTTLESISVSAALVLAAELDRWRRLFGIRLLVVDLSNWNAAALSLLYQFGLFNLLNVKNRPSRKQINLGLSRTDTVFVEFTTGSLVIGELAVALRLAIEGVIGASIDRNSRTYLFRSITEAMTNVIKHAYREDERQGGIPTVGRWWMSAAYNNTSQRLQITFFDQGVGIPNTLPRKYTLERIRGYFADSGLFDDDAERICAAMELGRTQTGNPYQGKGLPNVKQFIDASQDSKLYILSNRGCFVYTPHMKAVLVNHDRSIGGTLIQWEINVQC